MHVLEAKLVELAGDVLTAVGRGELAADSPLVRAAGAALAQLRPATEAAGTTPAATQPAAASPAGAGSARPARAAREAPPAVEQLLGVAALMRTDRRSFAAACSAVAAELGTSAQAVRNACTRWLGVSAGEWQPLLIEGADAAVLAIATRVAERCPWLVERIARDFGVAADALTGGPAR